jgi:hypothetical protein
MADIASSDVTYTLVKQRKEESSLKVINLTVAFGNGTLAYPSGGIPLDKAKMGCPNEVVSVLLNNPASSNGFLYKYDLANNKLRIYQGDNDNAADAALIELVAATATPAAATLSLEVKGW